MRLPFRILLFALMLLALVFGFLPLFMPKTFPYNFDRLHIFLFNLCSGGAILLYFTENRPQNSLKIKSFIILSIIYSLFAFFKLYVPVLVITLLLAALVESDRIRRFSFLPWDFFRASTPVSEKFHQAALLCLSLALLISGMVILNNHYFRMVSMPKLQLDTFFLGFSFPLSLITFSLLFALMKEKAGTVRFLKNIGFWFVNLGVIIFFLFIIFEKLMPQVFVTSVLFATVFMILLLLIRLGENLQQKAFLISGMGFLLYTAITGILYIIYEMSPDYATENFRWLMRMHSFASLYGWNLCGLAIICRYDDFPLRLHSNGLIAFHWLTVIVLAPLGIYFKPFAVAAVLCFAILLYAILFSQGKIHPRLIKTPQE